ncbi:MAG: hypothetical protein IJS86_07770, partial [Lachnospiraceae bacterium]|nr:hypothetical protein [Lachnospiraceae bacterium]
MKEQMKDIGKLLMKWVPVGLIGLLVLGLVTQGVILGISNYLSTGTMSLTGDDIRELFSLNTLIYGFVEIVIILVLVLVNGNSFVLKASKNMLKSKADRVEGSLENSRWMEDSERNELFPKTTFSKLSELKKDGIPLYAVYNSKKKDMDINIIPPAHGIIIGATGSGKTTTFVN